MLEVAYILVALALIVFLVYLIITVQKLGRVIDETEKTIKTLTSDVDVTLHHTNELLAKVNVLADDINVKVATIDPLFSAVADLSLSVSDLNDHARVLSKKASSAGSKTLKTGASLSALRLASNFSKIKRRILMGKLSSILLGTVSGAALALFLTSDKGKQVCSQAQDFLDDLREDPEYAKEQVCEKLTEVKEQATDFVLKTKEQVESGEITVDSILAQAKSYAFQATEASKNQLNNLKEQWQEKAEALDDSEEIVIDITEE